jgi:hypothetical protein
MKQKRFKRLVRKYVLEFLNDSMEWGKEFESKKISEPIIPKGLVLTEKLMALDRYNIQTCSAGEDAWQEQKQEADGNWIRYNDLVKVLNEVIG